MRFFAIITIILALCPSTLEARNIVKKGKFGVARNDNFVTFSYVLTYLGDSYKEGHVAFRLDFKDNKGYDLASEIDTTETFLKKFKGISIQGKVERRSLNSAVLLFPVEEGFILKGKINLYTVILGYKLRKTFKI